MSYAQKSLIFAFGEVALGPGGILYVSLRDNNPSIPLPASSPWWLEIGTGGSYSGPYVAPDVSGVFGTTNRISQIQRDALVALYNSTDGANWKNNTGWLGAD